MNGIEKTGIKLERHERDSTMERAQKKISAYICAMLVFVSGEKEAQAKVQYQYNKQQETYELLYQERESAPIVHIEPVSLSVIGEGENIRLPTERLHLAFFDRLRKTDIAGGGVNHDIKNPVLFREFIQGKIEQYKRELSIRGDITLQNLLQITAAIVKDNLSYEHSIASLDSPSYDWKLDLKISNTSLDDLLMKEKRGVCRHYAALFEKVAETIIGITDSQYLSNVIIDEIEMADENHAWNVIFFLTKKQDDYYLQVAFIDTTINPSRSSFEQIEELDKSYKLSSKRNLKTLYLNHLYSLLSSTDRIAIVRDSIALAKDEKEKLQCIVELAFTYSSQIRALLSTKKYNEARQLLHDADDYFTQWYARHKNDESTYQHANLIQTIMISIYNDVADHTNDYAAKRALYAHGLTWNDSFHFVIADLDVKMGNFDEARTFFLTKIEGISNSQTFEKVFTFFIEHNESEQAYKAIRSYERYLKVKERDSTEQVVGYLLLAAAHERLGNVPEKLAYLERAFLIDVGSSESRIERGERYADAVLKTGDVSKFENIYDEMFALYQGAKKAGKIITPIKRRVDGAGWIEVFADEAAYRQYREQLKRKYGQ